MYEENQEIRPEDVYIFCDFLGSLRGLKDLHLVHLSLENLFLTSTLAESAKFELEKLTIGVFVNDFTDYTMDFNQNYQNFIDFIYSQRASLKFVNLSRITVSADLIVSLLNMNLKKLSFYGANLNILSDVEAQNRSIEELSLAFSRHCIVPLSGIDETPNEAGICALIRNCLNMSKLSIYGLNVTFEIALTISKYVRNLKELSFGHCMLTPMSYPEICSISFRSCRDTDEIVKTLRLNNQLKHVTLPREILNHRKFHLVLSEINPNHEMEIIAL